MSQQTILFLGATGGVANACLTYALKSGTRTVALVRTPEKLRKQLKEQQKMTEPDFVGLEILQGDALDSASVKNALLASGSLPDVIVTALGPAPSLTFRPSDPLNIVKADNPTVCQNAAKTLVAALREIYIELRDLPIQKPHLVFVSTTGITRGQEDVPRGLRYLYHKLLREAHVDKKAMENVYRAESELPDGNGVFASVTGMRPTILKGAGILGEGVGPQKIRAGVEGEPELGYTISRGDVGAWMWNNVVSQDALRVGGSAWRGEMISLTA